MTRTARNGLLAGFALFVVLGLGAGVWWALRDPNVAPAPVDLGAAPAISVSNAPTDPTDEGRMPELAVDDTPAFQSLETTVIFPLKVELKLVRASSNPHADGAPELGAGASAKIAGSVTATKGAGVRARVTFVAGANKGRTLYADALGRFGAEGLYPGLSVVSITGPGIAGAQREVRLRPERETQLNVPFGRPSRVFADVVDADGKPLAGATVTLDGQTVVTADDGGAEFVSVAPGEVLVIVSKAGFAAVRQTLDIPGGTTVERGRLVFRIDPGASLQVSITDSLNANQKALLFILPEESDSDRKFPWQTVNPVEIWPGGTAIVEDLPRARVTLRLYHAGATAKPERRSVELNPASRRSVEFGLEPAPVVTGVVTDGGAPAENAIVRLEAPDRTAATLGVFGQSSYLFLESDVMPDLPPAMQQATTNVKGEYQLTAHEASSAVRYLTATSRDGKRVAHAVLRSGDVRADLALLPVQGGDGELAIQMPDRIQPLPVEVVVDGTPRDPFVLALGRDLRIGELPEGSWLVTVRWNDDVMTREQPLEIDGETRLFIALPEGAIFGQDEETRRRAGVR